MHTMPRSRCENENVQFVQELAEIDGPFESPININFRDLTKLELPALCWNRSESNPKKMKITNTGHTVIISGKWKSERPFLTGGPLTGKYVFSQIHFHWGKNDNEGSEHLVCGERFPLEMHVAHFKTEYVTQENALREKDGMVVLVYLFKLQEEPNAGLKRIINLLPSVQHPSTSQNVEPRPILSFCNPFTEDYFMYWGSVITSTCAHILLWIVCREPFGISREQMCEFRRLFDSSMQPICRNHRDPQPLHKRNVFHVNPSRYCDEAMLPTKKLMGCFCSKIEEFINDDSQFRTYCSCQSGVTRNQEDIEGNNIGFGTEPLRIDIQGGDTLGTQDMIPRNFFVHQALILNAQIRSAPILNKVFDGENLGKTYSGHDLKRTKFKGNSKLTSQSCCFFPTHLENYSKRQEKRKTRDRKPFNSKKAISHLMDSLEALKNHTFKKLREIECINQEIKGMKPLYQEPEDKKWIRRIEKIMLRQKRFTMRTSQSCFGELKKLAKECNFDRFFDNKLFPVGDNNKMVWYNSVETTDRALPCSDICMIEQPTEENKPASTSLDPNKVSKFSAKAVKIIQSFFEDIKESEDLQESVEKDLQLKKKESLQKSNKEGEDPNANPEKGYITQKMFVTEKLGDRFFAEVPTDVEMETSNLGKKKTDVDSVKKLQVSHIPRRKDLNKCKKEELQPNIRIPSTQIIPLQRANVPIESPKPNPPVQNLCTDEYLIEPNEIPTLDIFSESEYTSDSERILSGYYTDRTHGKSPLKNLDETSRKKHEKNSKIPKVLQTFDPKDMFIDLQNSNSSTSSDTSETQRMIIARLLHKRKSRKDIWGKKTSQTHAQKKVFEKYKKSKSRDINFVGYYIKRKNFKHKKKKIYKDGRLLKKALSSGGISSTSQDDAKGRSKWKGNFTRAKFRLKIEKASESPLDSSKEQSLISPERKKLKLEFNKVKTKRKTEKNLESENLSIDNSKNEKNKKRCGKDQDDADSIRKTKKDDGDKKSKVLTSRETEQEIRPSSRNVKNRSLGPSTVSSKGNISMKSSNRVSDKGCETPESKQEPVGEISPHENTSLESKCEIDAVNAAKKELGEITEKALLASLGRKITKDANKLRNKPLKVIEENQKVSESNCTALGKPVNRTNVKEGKEPEPKTPVLLTGRQEYMQNSDSFQKTKNQKSKSEYKVGFFTTTTSTQIGDDFPMKGKFDDEKSKYQRSKRCNLEKYHFLDREIQESPTDRLKITEEIHQDMVPTPIEGPRMKGDAENASKDKKELQDSFTAIKRTTTHSRPHSAESFNSQTKSENRKGKKRPHCCKRTSKHYIRKNSAVIRKLNKDESKPIQFLSLSEEEQLKIISANVAKYLKQKLIEQKNFDPDKSCSFADIEKVVLKDLMIPLDKSYNSNDVESNKGKTIEEEDEYKKKEDTNDVVKESIKEEEEEEKKEYITEETKNESTDKVNETESGEFENIEPQQENASAGNVPSKEVKNSKPVHNFIKLNKLMAGKYKRIQSVTEKNSDTSKIKDDSKEKTPKLLTKGNRKKREKNLPGKSKSPLTKSLLTQRNKTNNDRTERENVQKKLEQLKRSRKNSPREKNKPGQTKNESPDSSLAIRKVDLSKKCLVPAYMIAPYLPGPIEMVDNQPREIPGNRYLINVPTPTMGVCLPEVLYDSKTKNRGSKSPNEPLFSKDLEYLVKLQMCLNNEISANIENSMNYVKSLLSQEYNGTAIIEKPPINEQLDFYECYNKGIVLIEMNECKDYSSSSSDSKWGQTLTEDSQSQGEMKSKETTEIKDVTGTDLPTESGDSGIIRPIIEEADIQDEYNSDSSYNCEISITVNSRINEGDSTTKTMEPSLGEIYSNQVYDFGRDSSNSQATSRMFADDGSSSQSIPMKPYRKKRKENEISLEMKQKLLEILEGEINRELTGSQNPSSENSSDALTFKWDDSDMVTWSQSNDSSYDNIEVLNQISETMRQYLSEFKEKRWFADRLDESLDNNGKDEEAS